MGSKFATFLTGLLTLAICGGMVAPATAQEQPTSEPSAYQVANRAGSIRSLMTAPQPNEHPLVPTLRWAREGLKNMEQIQDYSTVMVKREQVDGKLADEEYLFLKVRHNPLSVYIYFLKPQAYQGREVIWIEGQNDGKLLAHGTGIQKVVGTLKLVPTGTLAMKGNRYPITDIGIRNLVNRLVEVGDHDCQFGECEVKFFPGAKINDRVCTCIQVIHPVPRRNFQFHIARIFVDDQLNLPIRFESYDWPKREGETPALLEQYTYLNLRLNNGFTDADFDVNNPQYNFNSK